MLFLLRLKVFFFVEHLGINRFFFVLVTRRRLRRPIKSTSTSVSVSNDQEVSSSITKFRRTRPHHRKTTSENSVVPEGKKDKDGPKIVCYYTNWSQYRVKIGKFTPEDIIPDLCTHIIFAFGWLKKGKLSSFESNDETKDGKVGLYERIHKLKKANPKLKTLLAIGKYAFSFVYGVGKKVSKSHVRFENILKIYECNLLLLRFILTYCRIFFTI